MATVTQTAVSELAVILLFGHLMANSCPFNRQTSMRFVCNLRTDIGAGLDMYMYSSIAHIYGSLTWWKTWSGSNKQVNLNTKIITTSNSSSSLIIAELRCTSCIKFCLWCHRSVLRYHYITLCMCNFFDNFSQNLICHLFTRTHTHIFTQFVQYFSRLLSSSHHIWNRTAVVSHTQCLFYCEMGAIYLFIALCDVESHRIATFINII